MKLKPVIWIALIVAAGLGGWLYFRSSPKAMSPGGEQKSRPAGKFQYSEVHPAPMAAVIPETLAINIRPVFTAGASYPERLAAVRTATTNLAAADWDALYSFLLTKSPADDEQNGQVLKNTLMDVLCALNPPPAQLADLLVQVYHDRTQNEAVRDYAVQHLATFYEQINAGSEDLRRARSYELSEAENALWEALAETDDSIAGTALLGLLRLGQGQPDFDAKAVSRAALKLAQDNSAGELSRITALQVCAKLHVSDALPLALNAAQPTETEPLRISALGALGVLGGSEQVAFLETLIQGADDRLKLPAQHALNQINQRLEGH